MAHVPFSRQHTEYDCVPVSLINGLAYLFKREQIPARVVQRIQLMSLDHVNDQGRTHRGTTPAAIKAIAEHLNESSSDRFSVKAAFKSGASFPKLWRHLERPNTVAAVRVEPSETETYAHYVLAIAVDSKWVHCFDPGSSRRIGAKDQDFLQYHESGVELPERRSQLSNLWIARERLQATRGRFAAAKNPEWVILQRTS